jgi:hypothetical protein
MALLNFYISRLCYNDANASQSPKQRNFDLLSSSEGLSVTNPISETRSILPGQTVLLQSTARSVATNLNSSEFEISLPKIGVDLSRLRWTGIGNPPNFRIGRSILCSATTLYSAQRMSPTAIKITLSGGGVNLSSVLNGDIIYLQENDASFASPLNPSSTGHGYTVLSIEGNSVIVRDNGMISEEVNISLGSNFDSVIRFFSSEGVQIGDKIRIAANSAFNSENKSKDFQVIDVTDRDIIFYNPQVIPETKISGVNTPFLFYSRLINFVCIEADSTIYLDFDASGNQFPVINGNTGSALFSATTNLISVAATNKNSEPITVSVQSCTIE